MPRDAMWNDWASWACHELATLLSLPPVPGPCDEIDREAHEAFLMLSTVPEDVRRYWLKDYGVPEIAWQAWNAMNGITGAGKA